MSKYIYGPCNKLGCIFLINLSELLKSYNYNLMLAWLKFPSNLKSDIKVW